MASFNVYQDQGNDVALPNNKLGKDGLKLQKRSVLGDINRTSHGELSLSTYDKTALLKGARGEKSVNVGCIKTIKENSEPIEKNKVYEEIRSPLRDLTFSELGPKNGECEKSKTELLSKPDNGMSVEKLPVPVLPSTITLQLDEIYDCSTYRYDIYQYLRRLETKHRPKAYYMRRQPDVTYSMRAILVDWLVEVGEEYKLHNETLFMAVSYIDRFLSQMAVVRAKLQLLGTTAMFIASKFEEIYPPEVSEFTYITDDTYTKKQVLRMEHLILKVLSFNLSCPTTYTFVVHISVSASLSEKTMMLAMYLSELTLLEADPYLQYNPSLIASGAIALAKHCLGDVDVWPRSLVNASGYHLSHLAPVVAHLNNTHTKAASATPHAIREKYKLSKYLIVSQIPCKKLVIRDSGASII